MIKLNRFFRTTMIAATLSMISVFSAFAQPLAVKNDSYVWTEVKENEWTCTDKDGKPVTGWAMHGDDTYYFDKKGVMRKGWVKDNGDWYLMDEKTGILVTEEDADGYYEIGTDGKWTGKTMD